MWLLIRNKIYCLMYVLSGYYLYNFSVFLQTMIFICTSNALFDLQINSFISVLYYRVMFRRTQLLNEDEV